MDAAMARDATDKIAVPALAHRGVEVALREARRETNHAAPTRRRLARRVAHAANELDEVGDVGKRGVDAREALARLGERDAAAVWDSPAARRPLAAAAREPRSAASGGTAPRRALRSYRGSRPRAASRRCSARSPRACAGGRARRGAAARRRSAGASERATPSRTRRRATSGAASHASKQTAAR